MGKPAASAASQARRRGIDAIGRHDHDLGEGAGFRNRHDAIADLELRHLRADRLDRAGGFEARHERRRVLHLVFAGGHQQVGEVEARPRRCGCAPAPGPGAPGSGRSLERQPVEAGERVADDGPHQKESAWAHLAGRRAGPVASPSASESRPASRPSRRRSRRDRAAPGPSPLRPRAPAPSVDLEADAEAHAAAARRNRRLPRRS